MQGTAAPLSTERLTLGISGMTCANCSTSVEKALHSVEGVESATVNLALERASVVVGAGGPDVATLRKAVEAAGYAVTLTPEEEESAAIALRSRIHHELYAAIALSLPITILAMMPQLVGLTMDDPRNG